MWFRITAITSVLEDDKAEVIFDIEAENIFDTKIKLNKLIFEQVISRVVEIEELENDKSVESND